MTRTCVESLATSLTRNGHRVIPARDGAEALAAIEREHVDLLVIDLVMPNIDGFEVLARLKELKKAEALPVVVVTGTDQSATELQALRLGAHVYLTKPIEAAALTEQVTRLLTHRPFKFPGVSRAARGVLPSGGRRWSSSITAFTVISFLSRSSTIVVSPFASLSSRARSGESIHPLAVD